MTKELYNELVHKGLITDNKMTLEYIEKYNLTLEDIITIPAILEMLLSNAPASVNETPVVEEVSTPELTPVVEPVVEEVSAPKSKSKKN